MNKQKQRRKGRCRNAVLFLLREGIEYQRKRLERDVQCAGVVGIHALADPVDQHAEEHVGIHVRNGLHFLLREVLRFRPAGDDRVGVMIGGLPREALQLLHAEAAEHVQHNLTLAVQIVHKPLKLLADALGVLAGFEITELEQIVSKIDGAGEVNILITMDSTAEDVYILQKNIDERAKSSGGSDYPDSESEYKEENEYVIIKSKDGNEQAVLQKQVMPRIRGVLVVCSGGGNSLTREKITKAVSSVLNISTGKVYVTS